VARRWLADGSARAPARSRSFLASKGPARWIESRARAIADGRRQPATHPRCHCSSMLSPDDLGHSGVLRHQAPACARARMRVCAPSDPASSHPRRRPFASAMFPSRTRGPGKTSRAEPSHCRPVRGMQRVGCTSPRARAAESLKKNKTGSAPQTHQNVRNSQSYSVRKSPAMLLPQKKTQVAHSQANAWRRSVVLGVGKEGIVCAGSASWRGGFDRFAATSPLLACCWPAVRGWALGSRSEIAGVKKNSERRRLRLDAVVARGSLSM
jgi:hypothetical protein